MCSARTGACSPSAITSFMLLCERLRFRPSVTESSSPVIQRREEGGFYSFGCCNLLLWFASLKVASDDDDDDVSLGDDFQASAGKPSHDVI